MMCPLNARPALGLYGRRPLKWTEEDLDRLCLMWTGGLPIDDIAKELGRTSSAVTVRASILGLPRRTRGLGRLGANKRAASEQLPAGCCFEDDPRAATEIDRLPASVRGNVTAALMGDPVPGRSAP
jgi:hypothetical protein